MTLSPQLALRSLSNRDQIGPFMAAMGLVGKGVEVGVLYGTYSAHILKTWGGRLYCVDLWERQPESVYFDSANKLDLDAVFSGVKRTIGTNPRCALLRMASLNAVGRFDDGELDFVHLDDNHAVDAVRAGIAAWFPKVKVGGIFSGHDFNTRYDHETNSDALTAVMEFAEAIGVRPHVTWCTSWWFIKTEEMDGKFREIAMHGGLLPRPVYSNNEGLGCVVVLPVARFDWNLACKWLRWTAILSSRHPPIQFTGIVAYVSPSLSEEKIAELKDAGPKESRFSVVVASQVNEKGYFGTPNQMFKGALEYCEREFPSCAMLWCEADTVPMRPSWVSDIMAEYRACGRPFMGDLQREGPRPHLTGNAVYHPAWRTLAPSLAALGSEACGWDSLCAFDLVPRSHVSKTIQQIWRPPLPITAAWAKANIRPETALFHQCKDGSLIDVLCRESGSEMIPLMPAICASTYETQRGKQSQSVVAIASEVVGTPKSGVEIMIVSCRRDLEFVHYCLNSIAKYARGFDGVKLVVPEADRRQFHFAEKLPGVMLVGFNERPGKGFLHHMIMKCRADEVCRDSKYVLMLDSDCMFWKPVTPEDYLPGGKPRIQRERYEDIAKRNPNRLIWLKCIQKCAGFEPEFETMCAHPQIYRRNLFPHVRALVEAHIKLSFDEYVFSCENGFPQGFCEHNLLGAVAIRDFPESYHFIDYNHEEDAQFCGAPAASFQYAYRPTRDFMVEGWTHSGLARYKADWDRFMRGDLPKFYIK